MCQLLDKSIELCLVPNMFGKHFSLRRSASLLVALWLGAWLTPIFHQTQCTARHHGETACPICQLATTTIMAAPSQTVPVPIHTITVRPASITTTFPALLFQVEHPPRGPPPVFSAV